MLSFANFVEQMSPINVIIMGEQLNVKQRQSISETPAIVSLLSTTMVFGRPLEVTLSELAMSASSLGMQARAKSSQAELDELREVDTA